MPCGESASGCWRTCAPSSVALATPADQASERFPAAEPPAAATMAFPAPAPANRSYEFAARVDDTFPFGACDDDRFPFGPQTEPSPSMTDEASDPASLTEDVPEVAEPKQPGDTGSWLVGLEPPEQQPE